MQLGNPLDVVESLAFRFRWLSQLPRKKWLDGEVDIIARFEREVPSSNPGRAADVRQSQIAACLAPIGQAPIGHLFRNKLDP
jgi:hypothetical protein